MKFKISQSCQVTLWAIQSMKFSRPEYWSGKPFPYPVYLPNPGIELGSSALQADSLPTELSGKPTRFTYYINIIFSLCFYLAILFILNISLNHIQLFSMIRGNVLSWILILKLTVIQVKGIYQEAI